MQGNSSLSVSRFTNDLTGGAAPPVDAAAAAAAAAGPRAAAAAAAAAALVAIGPRASVANAKKNYRRF